MQIEPIQEGNYYHIYNRGINGTNIFTEERNYHYFLELYKKYCSQAITTLAYALLQNHFHLLVYIQENVMVPKYAGEGYIKLNASKQLSHCFNAYAQAFNKANNRTGSLLENPFKRKKISNSHYLTQLILYCHFNAQQHGFVNNFTDWQFTSYHSVIHNNNYIINTSKVIEWFGSLDAFKKAHQTQLDNNVVKDVCIEK